MYRFLATTNNWRFLGLASIRYFRHALISSKLESQSLENKDFYFTLLLLRLEFRMSRCLFEWNLLYPRRRVRCFCKGVYCSLQSFQSLNYVAQIAESHWFGRLHKSSTIHRQSGTVRPGISFKKSFRSFRKLSTIFQTKPFKIFGWTTIWG